MSYYCRFDQGLGRAAAYKQRSQQDALRDFGEEAWHAHSCMSHKEINGCQGHISVFPIDDGPSSVVTRQRCTGSRPLTASFSQLVSCSGEHEAAAVTVDRITASRIQRL